MTYSKEVEEMCPVAKGVNHGPAPIPEEGKWVKAKEVTDISETSVQTTTEKPERIKKEKKKKEKPSKLKKQTETPRREPRTRNENERTYLDDISDMLTELEEYKNRTDTETEKTDGGDEE